MVDSIVHLARTAIYPIERVNASQTRKTISRPPDRTRANDPLEAHLCGNFSWGYLFNSRREVERWLLTWGWRWRWTRFSGIAKKDCWMLLQHHLAHRPFALRCCLSKALNAKSKKITKCGFEMALLIFVFFGECVDIASRFLAWKFIEALCNVRTD